MKKQLTVWSRVDKGWSDEQRKTLIQMERQGRNLFPSIREYARFFGLNRERLKNARDDVLIMHPGPVNRGVEVSADILDSPYAIILDQVTNGVAVRMALMYLLIGK